MCASSHVSGARVYLSLSHHLYENRPTFPRSDIDITHFPRLLHKDKNPTLAVLGLDEIGIIFLLDETSHLSASK